MHRINYLTKHDVNDHSHVPFPNNAYQTPYLGNRLITQNMETLLTILTLWIL